MPKAKIMLVLNFTSLQSCLILYSPVCLVQTSVVQFTQLYSTLLHCTPLYFNLLHFTPCRQVYILARMANSVPLNHNPISLKNVHLECTIYKNFQKNLAYGRQRISRPMRIVGPIQFWRSCVIYLIFYYFFIFLV